MILNVESCKDSTKALLKFANFAGYKISTPKSNAFLYSNSEQLEEVNNSIYDSIKKIEMLRN